jgi:hypothetical protein
MMPGVISMSGMLRYVDEYAIPTYTQKRIEFTSPGIKWMGPSQQDLSGHCTF